MTLDRQRTHDPRQVLGRDERKPCPTCYAPMSRTTGSSWECAKHGNPETKVRPSTR